jgi:hypothetical protein
MIEEWLRRNAWLAEWFALVAILVVLALGAGLLR